MEIVLPDGRLIETTSVVVLGRAPQPGAHLPHHAVMVPLSDPEVSMTHLAIGRDDDGPWVMDLHSTNGSAVESATPRMLLTAGVRVAVDLPARLTIGQTRIGVRQR